MSAEDHVGSSRKDAPHPSPSAIDPGLSTNISLIYADLDSFNMNNGNSNFSTHDIASLCQLPSIEDTFSLNLLDQNGDNRTTNSGIDPQDSLLLYTDGMSGSSSLANSIPDQVFVSSAADRSNYGNLAGSSTALSYTSARNVGATDNLVCAPSTSSAPSSPLSTALLTEAGIDNNLFHEALGGFMTPNSSFKDSSFYNLATSMATMDDRTKFNMTPSSTLYHVPEHQHSSPLQFKSERTECKVETTDEFMGDEDRINSPSGYSNQFSLCSPISGTSGVEYTNYGGGVSSQQIYPSNVGPAVPVSPPNSTTASPYRTSFSLQGVRGSLTPSGLPSPMFRDGGEGANVADDGAALPHNTSGYHIVSMDSSTPSDHWNLPFTVQNKSLDEQLDLSNQILRQQIQQQSGVGNLQNQQLQQSQQMLQQQLNNQQHSASMQLGNGQHASSNTPPHLLSLAQHFTARHNKQQEQQQPSQSSPGAGQQFRYCEPHPYNLVSPPAAAGHVAMGQQHVVGSSSSTQVSPVYQSGSGVAPGRGRKRGLSATPRTSNKALRMPKDVILNKGIAPPARSDPLVSQEGLGGSSVFYLPGDVTVRTFPDLKVSPEAYMDCNGSPGSSISESSSSSVDADDFADLSLGQYSTDSGSVQVNCAPKKKAKCTKKPGPAAKKRGRPSSYKCGNCKQPYTTAALLRKHLADCATDDISDDTSGPLLLQCTVKSCVHETYDKVEHENHMKDHMTRDGLTPTGRRRQSKKPLKRHRYVKEEMHCDECSYVATVEKSFYTHHELHDTGAAIVHFASCPVCGLDFPSASDIRPHINSEHTIINPIDCKRHVACDLCDFNSVQIKKLIQHRRLHSGEKPHICPACDYRAGRRDNLRSHFRRVHGEENIFADTYRPIAQISAGRARMKRMQQQGNNLTANLGDDSLMNNLNQQQPDCFSGDIMHGTGMVLLGESSGMSITSDPLSFGDEHHQEQFAMGDPSLAHIHVSPLGDNYGDMVDLGGDAYSIPEEQKILMQAQTLGNGFSAWADSDSTDPGIQLSSSC